ncbi:hypothetical protein R6Z07F_020392 [Ovis aries]
MIRRDARGRGAGHDGSGGWPGTRGAVAGERKTQGEGVGKALTQAGNPTDRPTDRPAPPGARMPDHAHTFGVPPPPRRGTSGGGQRAPPPPHPTLVASPPAPAAPGAGPGTPDQATLGTADVPSASVGPPAPEGWGMPGGKDTATGMRGTDRGPDPRSGERTGTGARRGSGGAAGVTSAPPRPARDDVGGQEVAKPATDRGRGGPGKQDTPGEQQTGRGLRRTDRERGTDGVRPPEAKATEPAVEVGWRRATTRGMAQNDPGEASRPPGRTAGSHRQRPPSTGAASRHTWDDRLAPPSRGSRPPPPTHSEPQPARENALPPRTGVPHGPHTRNPAVPGSPPRPLSQGLEGTALPGDATGGRRRGDDTHVRRGRLGPRQRKGTRAVARAGRGGGPAAAGRGRQVRTAGAFRGPENPGTRPGSQEIQRGIPPPPTQKGGPPTPGTPASPSHPQSGPHNPAPPPGPACRPPVFLRPSSTDPSFHLV